ncbi:MAG TPA: Tol-Pal system protein TolB [Sphingomicrobium sp.]|jgi:TolB protein|nr:Tol-Pal system protein TolB [Sphingomicrobium sp.]
MKAIRAGTFALLAAACAAGTASAAQPGTPAATVIAIPPMTTPDAGTKGNEMLAVAWQATKLIQLDLGQTSELMPLEPNRRDYYSYPEVTAPSFPKWRDRGARALITGFVQSRSDGRLTIGCYVYDVDKGRELGRVGFVAAPSEIRRAAHKCSGLAYKVVTGSPGMFDTRIAYVAETGSPGARVKRIAVMDSDGNDHSYVTPGGTSVLTPRLSPKAHHLAYVSFEGGVPQVQIVDLDSGRQQPLLQGQTMSFAPRYSPDGTKIVFSMMLGANSDIYVVGENGGMPRRLTTSPGIDTDPCFSPDGSRIVFESDRSGTQQLYVMDSDGSNERRITFSTAAYSAPEWSPDGKLIAFTWRFGDTRRIGIMSPDGTGEKILTQGPADEEPSWAASSRELVFQRTDPSGRPGIYRVSLDGSPARKMTIPQDGSDPNWSGTMD